MEPISILSAVMAFLTVVAVGFVFAGNGNSQTRALRRLQIEGGIGPGRMDRERRTADRRMGGIDHPANDPNARRKQIVKSLNEQDRQARKATVTLSARLQQAGLALEVKIFWLGSATIAVLVLLPLLLLHAPPLIAFGAAFSAGFGLPRWIVGFLARRRTKKFIIAFSDAIDIIVRGIRSGLPVHDCLKIIARECPEPVGSEFQRLVENLSLGLDIDQALEKLCERMPTPELRYFAIVLAIQSKTGGNLGEALANLSSVLRGRRLMREKIKAMSSEAVASSFIIGSLPPAVVLLITVTSPSYLGPMFSTGLGHILLMTAGGLMVTGIFIMRKMINFEF